MSLPTPTPAAATLTGTVSTRAHVHFGGQCVSHGIVLPDGRKKSVGVMLAATLHFGTEAPEVMEIVDGACRVKLAGSADWTPYRAGQSFEVPGQSSFDIEVSETLHYVCHFG